MCEWLAAADGREVLGLVGLTFDDGYRDFVEYAVAARHGMMTSVYMVTGKLGGRSDWDSSCAGRC